MNTHELKDAMVDVRKSYRILAVYQRRVLDVVKYIGDYYGYAFMGGFSKFSSHAPEGSRMKDLSRWSWDWLSMYEYEFFFGTKNEITFSVLHQADTGFYDHKLSNRTQVEEFSPAENCDTRLILCVCKGQGEHPWTNMLKRDLNKSKEKVTLEDSGTNWTGKSYSMHHFLDQQTTISALENFTAFMNSQGIIFDRVIR